MRICKRYPDFPVQCLSPPWLCPHSRAHVLTPSNFASRESLRASHPHLYMVGAGFLSTPARRTGLQVPHLVSKSDRDLRASQVLSGRCSIRCRLSTPRPLSCCSASPGRRMRKGRRTQKREGTPQWKQACALLGGCEQFVGWKAKSLVFLRVTADNIVDEQIDWAREQEEDST